MTTAALQYAVVRRDRPHRNNGPAGHVMVILLLLPTMVILLQLSRLVLSFRMSQKTALAAVESRCRRKCSSSGGGSSRSSSNANQSWSGNQHHSKMGPSEREYLHFRRLRVE